ncbi:D-beta-hydroxybutyrate dehydrogenase, mitochondrial-like isoform X2 [Ranitomeya variabilis]|uniref:D-beta-hydroxybutyrate dehydrogenase, mitochondrial-like isoform X2 n=1 Tax=Ranitomeya variabilis TaxID=490064 RepID=UPI0040572EE3
MAVPGSSLRTALLVLLSLGLTLALGLLLPEALKLLFSVLGFPCDNASHAIVLVYFVFMLFVAMPAFPRGTVPDKNGEGAKELQSLCCNRMKVLQLNVCSQEEVTQAVEFLAKNLEDPHKGLWGLVNNAGISTFGDIEFTSLDTYKEVAEVNLWGTIRVTKAFLPLVRESKGRVLCMASMFGRMGCPSRSSYCVSKYGVEAFSDCLRQEMYKWKVKVITIEPGNFTAATGIFTKEGVENRGQDMWEQASETVRADYGKVYFSHQVSRMKAFVSSGVKDMSPVINALADALTSKYPYTRYNPMDTYCWIKVQVMSHLPTAIADRIYI